uniref:hypothetical protein n=1 Tax=Phascolarctobacterium sp. TaxID=2049039 RepID=UPI00386B5815
TFGGDKLMTRYEMAQIVAKAMAKGANVDKLAAEFADELDNLGVRVANLEKKADNVKITGEIRAHYESYDDDTRAESSKLRTRIWMNGQINEDWSYTGMIQNEQDLLNDAGDETTKFQRAFVNGKIGGLKVEAGRNNASILGGEILSNRADRVKVAYGKDVKLAVEGGKLASDDGISGANHSLGEKYYAASLSGKVAGIGLEAVYVDVKDQMMAKGTFEDNNIWAVAADYKLSKDLGIKAAYLKGDLENAKGEDDGWYAGLTYKGAKASKPGSWGVYATYYDMAASTMIANGWASGFANKMQQEKGGFEGWKAGVNYALAKNIVAQVEYMDLEGKTDDKKDDSAIWSQVVFTF